jgi:hypothetical protein
MSHGSPQVAFRNAYGKRIYVAYMRCHPDCESYFRTFGDPWQVRGWIQLDAGETEYRSNPTRNQWFYYYAEAEDGAYWAGPYTAHVSNWAFTSCEGYWLTLHKIGFSPYAVGMRELDTATWSGVQFTP